jgi:Zn-dependent alcohol dehydrogenase
MVQGQMMAVPEPRDGAPLELLPLALPEPAAGEVLLRVDVAGLCPSDLHILDGIAARSKRPAGLLTERVSGVPRDSLAPRGKPSWVISR